ncbi:hypothetical protein CBR_g8073 [Chara braunii]|uniref:Uncharacterized protein n=1 Tax=Chara braunii TaxID=69332 RepID=A0A388KL51_CHABU|nr:hypothetical protein CBR_g8073 [Chara braunii]|eukprot:GBG70775.1 hypothetical protein CBR_g8073 [Chara braunii]
MELKLLCKLMLGLVAVIALGLVGGASAEVHNKTLDFSLLDPNYPCYSQILLVVLSCSNDPNRTEDCSRVCSTTSAALLNCTVGRADDVTLQVLSSEPYLQICAPGAINNPSALGDVAPQNHPCIAPILQAVAACSDQLNATEQCSTGCSAAATAVLACVADKSDDMSLAVQSQQRIQLCGAGAYNAPGPPPADNVISVPPPPDSNAFFVPPPPPPPPPPADDGSGGPQMPPDYPCRSQVLTADYACANEPNKTEDCSEECKAASPVLSDCIRGRTDVFSDNLSTWTVLDVCGNGAIKGWDATLWKQVSNHTCNASILGVSPVCRDIARSENCTSECKTASRQALACVKNKKDEVSTKVRSEEMFLRCSAAASAVWLSASTISIAALILIVDLLLRLS